MIVELLRGGSMKLEGNVIESYINEKIGGITVIMSTGLKVTIPITDDNIKLFNVNINAN